MNLQQEAQRPNLDILGWQLDYGVGTLIAKIPSAPKSPEALKDVNALAVVCDEGNGCDTNAWLIVDK